MSTRGEDTREHILATAHALVMEHGFAGTSIDDILQAAKLSKGAFFYHFKNKSDLGHALVVRYAEHDLALFEQFAQRADRLSDDPLQSALIFIKLFEEYLEGLGELHPGCLFASYVYEQENFDKSVSQCVAKGFESWKKVYTARFAAIAKKHQPRQPVLADELAELIMSIIQGSFILAKSSADRHVVIRNVRHFRRYLEMLFSA